MVVEATNIDFILNNMLKTNYSYAKIGKIFEYGLSHKQRDILAFHSDIEPKSVRNAQKETMRRIKSYLFSSTLEDNQTYEPKTNLNANSLLGIINLILEEKGEEGFEDIGKAIHQGSKEYLKKNPLARNTNYKQFLEYKAIQSELQNLL